MKKEGERRIPASYLRNTTDGLTILGWTLLAVGLAKLTALEITTFPVVLQEDNKRSPMDVLTERGDDTEVTIYLATAAYGMLLTILRVLHTYKEAEIQAEAEKNHALLE